MAKLSPRDMSCSAPGWVSGGTTGHGIDGYRFEPFRVTGLPWPRMHQHGDHHGRLFPSVEAGSAFSLERGYSVVYRGPYAVARKVHRDKLAAARRSCSSSGASDRASWWRVRLFAARCAT